MLVACAQAPRQPDGGHPIAGLEPPLSGRLVLQVEGMPERSFAADFELRGSARQGELMLSGPLGATAARAQWAPGMARLVSLQGESSAPDLDTLAEQALGTALPIAALFDWLRGRPFAPAPTLPLDNGEPGFDQLGWQVSLTRLAERRIEVRRMAPPKVTVRLLLDDS